MTVRPPPRPLPPVLGRMAVGLLVAGAGALVASQGVTFSPTPGMAAVSTPLSVPLDGGAASTGAAGVHVRGDRVDVSVAGLDAGSPFLLRGSALHRGRNPVILDAGRVAGQVVATLRLNVQGLDRAGGGVVVSGPEPLQHRVTLAVSRDVPVSLSSQTTSGDQDLDLTPLRVRALSVRSGGGTQRVVIPGRPAGPLSLVSVGGDVTVRAPDGASPEALRVNTQGGHLRLDLAGARLLALGAGSLGGSVRVTLPQAFARGTLTTSSGALTVTAPPTLTSGNLDIRTQSGAVTLRVPPRLRVRVRFTDRDTVILPRGTPPATAPQLDVFMDTGSGTVTVEDTDGTDLNPPGPSARAAPPPPPTPPSSTPSSSPSQETP